MAKYWFRQKTFRLRRDAQHLAGLGADHRQLRGLVRRGAAGPRHPRQWPARDLDDRSGSAVVLVPTCVLAYVKTEGGWRWR